MSALEQAAQAFAVSITPPMQELIDAEGPIGPIARQFLPDPREVLVTPEERADPIGDGAHMPVKGIVHRYPDRVLLMALKACPVHCRFCFRRESIGSEGVLGDADLTKAIAYIEAREQVWEVILSGGDPLILSPRRLESITKALADIAHVGVLRVHSRVPAVDPERITPALIEALRPGKPAFVVLHANHPSELTPAARAACARLVDAGIPMLSQTVLLKGINDSPEVLTALFRALVETRIKPYYLHQGDLAAGTGHFRTTLAEGQDVMRRLRGRVSGLCQPTYVLDIPGGHGKVPIGPSFLRENPDGSGGHVVTDPDGIEHDYPCPGKTAGGP